MRSWATVRACSARPGSLCLLWVWVKTSSPGVTRPDLQPTQRMPIVAEEPDRFAQLPPRSGPNVLGFLFRAVLVIVLLASLAVAAALLLTPTRESVLILGSDARPDELKRGEVGRTDTLLLFLADRAAPRV